MSEIHGGPSSATSFFQSGHAYPSPVNEKKGTGLVDDFIELVERYTLQVSVSRL